jgi:hypothetical protein
METQFNYGTAIVVSLILRMSGELVEAVADAGRWALLNSQAGRCETITSRVLAVTPVSIFHEQVCVSPLLIRRVFSK